jgi:hypothetical protein
VRSGVTEGRAEKDALFAFPSTTCAADMGEIVVADGFNLEGFAAIVGEKAKGEDAEYAGWSKGRDEEEKGEEEDGENDASSY